MRHAKAGWWMAAARMTAAVLWISAATGCAQPAPVNLLPVQPAPELGTVPVLAAVPGDGFDRALAWLQAPAPGGEQIDYAPLFDHKIFEGIEDKPLVEPKAEMKAEVKAVKRSPRTSLGLYFEGRTLWHRRQFNEAVAKLERARTLDPASFQVNLLLGRIYLAGGSRELAKQRLEAAVAEEPENFDAHYYLGSLHYAARSWASAATELKAALGNRVPQDDASSPKVAQAWLYLGRSAQEQQQWMDAVRCYRAVLGSIERGIRAGSPEESDYHGQLVNPSMLYVRLSECFEKASMKEKALAAAESAAKVHPAGRVPNGRLVSLQLAEKLHDAAVRTARRFAEAYQGGDALALGVLEETYQAAGRPAEQLIDAVREIRKRNPDNPALMRFLAEKLKAAGRDKEAALLFEELKTLESPTVESLLKLAEQREGHGDRAGALRVLARGVFHTKQDDAGVRKLLGAVDEAIRRETDLVGLVRRVGELRSGDDVSAAYLDAVLAIEARQFDPALTLLEQVIQQRPRFVQAYDRLAQVHLRQAIADNDHTRRVRRLEQALRVYTKAVEAKSADSNYFRRQAARVVYQIYTIERLRDPIGRGPVKRLEQAKTMLEEAIKAEPDEIEGRATLIEVLLETDDIKAALAQALELTRRHPKEEATLALLRVLSFARELEKAVAAADEFLKRNPDSVAVLARKAAVQEAMHEYPAAIATLKAALAKANAEQTRALRPELVENLIRIENYSEACDHLKNLIDDEQKTARAGDMNADQLRLARRTALVRLLLQAEKIDDAGAILEELTKAGGKDLGVVQCRVLLSAKRKDDAGLKSAADDYRKLIRETNTEADDKAIELAVADAYSLAGRTDLAEKTIRDKLATERRDPVLRLTLARILAASKKDYDEAAKIARELLEEIPNEQGRLMVLRLLGSILSMQKKLKESADVLEKAYPVNRIVNPDDVGLDNDLGYTWADLGLNLEKAREMVQRAVDAEPYNAAYRDSMGWVLYKLGDFKSALIHLKRAVAAYEGQDPVLFDHLGDTLWRTGERKEAQDAWKRSVELFEKKDKKDPVEQERVRVKIRDAQAGKEPAVAPLGDQRKPLGT